MVPTFWEGPDNFVLLPQNLHLELFWTLRVKATEIVIPRVPSPFCWVAGNWFNLNHNESSHLMLV